MTHKPVLLAEDSEDDVFLFMEACRKAGVTRDITRVHDGQDAIDYLSGIDQYADRDRYPLPCVIISDIKMPRVDGFELLHWLQQHPALNHIPVLMLTSSALETDQARARHLGCAEFFTKPGAFRQLADLVRHIDREWLVKHSP